MEVPAREGLRMRVQARLDALGINPFEAARRANFERSFVNDLLIGKKSSIRERKLKALAEVLECDAAFLRGQQGVPRAGDQAGRMPLAGICEAGVWREPGGELAGASIPYLPDPRFPVDRQQLFLVRGDHAAPLGIVDGSILVVIAGENCRDGDHVVARRIRSTGDAETTVRLLAGGALSAAPLPTTIESPLIPLNEAEIVGRIVVAYRVL